MSDAIQSIKDYATYVSRPCRVLVVEDEPIFRRLLVKILTDILGVQCVEADTGMQSLAIFNTALANAHESNGRTKHPFDVVFMDQHLPDIHGLTVIRLMRDKWPAQPIVVCTGYDILIDRAYGCGVFGVMFKGSYDSPGTLIDNLRHIFSALNLPVKTDMG